jgi:hypothetical protein
MQTEMSRLVESEHNNVEIERFSQNCLVKRMIILHSAFTLLYRSVGRRKLGPIGLQRPPLPPFPSTSVSTALPKLANG